MSDEKDSPRQRLRRFVDSGELRYALERSAGARVDGDVIDLAVAIIDRYCAPRLRLKRKARP